MLRRAHFSASHLQIVKRFSGGELPSPGSFVRLNSGGPIGVVSDLLTGDRVRVSWLTKSIVRSELPDRCLTLVC